MNTKRKRYDWTEPYGAYRRHLVFFDLATMIPGDFRGVFREKGGGVPENPRGGTD